MPVSLQSLKPIQKGTGLWYFKKLDRAIRIFDDFLVHFIHTPDYMKPAHDNIYLFSKSSM
jgi:hypothetical protein